MIILIIAILTVGGIHAFYRSKELENDNSQSSAMEESKIGYRRKLTPVRIFLIYLLLASPLIFYVVSGFVSIIMFGNALDSHGVNR